MTRHSLSDSIQGQHLIATLILTVVSLSGNPTSTAEQANDFALARPGYRYQFPRDHGSHESFRTEWWYYTGQLTATDGRTFGYQLTFFRRGIPSDEIKTLPSKWSITQLYLAHFAVTDPARHRFHYDEKISRAGLGKAGAESSQLHVWIDNWRAGSPQDAPTVHQLTAGGGDWAINLELAPSKPPTIHGTDGTSHKGKQEGQASHYYSFTRMETSGTLKIGDEWLAVTGTSWMDHEFGSAELSQDLVGWDWFSLQLDNNTELMLYRLRRADGSADPVSSGTFVDRAGKSRHLSISDFSLEPTSYWTSPASKARYPQRWRLTVPSAGLSLELTPKMAEQELITSRSTQVTYWEGAIGVSGVGERKLITGHGYMELTGYAERFAKKL